MLAEHRVHHASSGREEFIIFYFAGVPLTVGDFKNRAQEIRECLIGTEDPEIALILIQLGHVTQEPAQHERILAVNGAGRRYIHRVVVKSGMRKSRSRMPPLAWGLAPIRRSPLGARSANSGMSRPFSSNSSSAL